jgi:hypothetical protein
MEDVKEVGLGLMKKTYHFGCLDAGNRLRL